MNKEKCKLEIGLFNRICYSCGTVMYAPRMIAIRIFHNSRTETLVKEKVLRSLGIIKNIAKKILWFLWFVPLMIAIIAAIVLLLVAVILTIGLYVYYLMIAYL